LVSTPCTSVINAFVITAENSSCKHWSTQVFPSNPVFENREKNSNKT
jgi:hypothetical protein